MEVLLVQVDVTFDMFPRIVQLQIRAVEQAIGALIDDLV